MICDKRSLLTEPETTPRRCLFGSLLVGSGVSLAFAPWCWSRDVQTNRVVASTNKMMFASRLCPTSMIPHGEGWFCKAVGCSSLPATASLESWCSWTMTRRAITVVVEGRLREDNKMDAYDAKGSQSMDGEQSRRRPVARR